MPVVTFEKGNYNCETWSMTGDLVLPEYRVLAEVRIPLTCGEGPHTLENHKWLYVSLEILVRPPRKMIGPLASRERSVRHSLKYVDD